MQAKTILKGGAVLGVAAYGGKFLADRLVGGEDGLDPNGGAPILAPRVDSLLNRVPGSVDAGDVAYWLIVGVVVVIAGALLRKAV